MEECEDSFVYLHAEVLPEKLQETEKKKKEQETDTTSDNIRCLPMDRWKICIYMPENCKMKKIQDIEPWKANLELDKSAIGSELV